MQPSVATAKNVRIYFLRFGTFLWAQFVKRPTTLNSISQKHSFRAFFISMYFGVICYKVNCNLKNWNQLIVPHNVYIAANCSICFHSFIGFAIFFRDIRRRPSCSEPLWWNYQKKAVALKIHWNIVKKFVLIFLKIIGKNGFFELIKYYQL